MDGLDTVGIECRSTVSSGPIGQAKDAMEAMDLHFKKSFLGNVHKRGTKIAGHTAICMVRQPKKGQKCSKIVFFRGSKKYLKTLYVGRHEN
jgi:hypothetical protein